MTGKFMERFLKMKVPPREENDVLSHEQNDGPSHEEKYLPNQKDVVRRKYLDNGPCQPRTFDFPYSTIGGKNRRFNSEWFAEFGSWLEYSESKDRAYCFYCFLFRGHNKKEARYDAFVTTS